MLVLLIMVFRYQGVDWRNKSNWGCNGGKSPSGLNYYDGIDLDPYEVLVLVRLSTGQKPPMGLWKIHDLSPYKTYEKIEMMSLSDQV
jgi:hypothetical protein